LYIPEDVFDKIARYAPIPSVDIVIWKDGKVMLTRRTIAPHKGFWHLPGSIVKRKERMTDAVLRCAEKELGIKVQVVRFVNYYELFTSIRHYISHLFVARYLSGDIKLDFQGSALRLADPKAFQRARCQATSSWSPTRRNTSAWARCPAPRLQMATQAGL
jgi:ADP-ribose pyrophosphatase YjhB (NUDIX family)